jgi:uncharacterized protein YbjT (DUF2867 family)
MAATDPNNQPQNPNHNHNPPQRASSFGASGGNGDGANANPKTRAAPQRASSSSAAAPSAAATLGTFRRLSIADAEEGRLVVVAGATGHLGQEVCLALLRRRYRVLALCRPSASAAPVARLRRAGAQIFLAEVTNPTSYAGVAVGAAAIVSCLGARHPSAGEKADKAAAAAANGNGSGGGGSPLTLARTASYTSGGGGGGAGAGAAVGGAPHASSLGGSSGPFAVDRDAVVSLFREARGAGVPLFVAVGSLEGPATRGMAEFIRAKEEAFDTIRRLAEGCTTWWTVVRPGAMTKEFETIVARKIAATKSFTIVGDGSALFAPVTAHDLAAFIADGVVGRAPRVNGGSFRGGAAALAASGAAGAAASAVLNKDVTIAGPEVLSYKEAVLQVADAVGVGRENVKLRHAPPWLFKAVAGALTCVGATAKAGVFRWLCYCMTHSMVGDVRVGETTLAEAVARAWADRSGRGSGRGSGSSFSSGAAAGGGGSGSGRQSPTPLPAPVA